MINYASAVVNQEQSHMQIIVNIGTRTAIAHAIAMLTAIHKTLPEIDAVGRVVDGNPITAKYVTDGQPPDGPPAHVNLVGQGQMPDGPPVHANIAAPFLPMPGVPITGNELDVDGIPWDDRIHASTKTKTQKGLWTRKKGIEDALYTSVLASLKSAASAPAIVQQVAPPIVETRPMAPAVAIVQTIPPIVTAPKLPPVVVAVPFPPAGWLVHPEAEGWYYKGSEVKSEADLRAMSATGAAGVTWESITDLMSVKMQEGRCTHETLNAMANKYQSFPFATVSGKPHLWQAVFDELTAL